MKLGLGTVQLGLPYGLTNRRGQVAADAALDLLQVAVERGVELLDTAPAYGEAERIIGSALRAGQRFRVVTKTGYAAGASAQPAPAALRETFLRSLERLQVPRLSGLLLHSCADALAPGGRALIEEMQRLRAERLVERIGVSVYEVNELAAISDVFLPDIVQLPVSVINQSFIESGAIARLASAGVEIHARSIFLQGALLAAPAALPPELAPLRARIGEFQAHARESGASPLEGALAFVARQPEISVAIVGVTGRDELLQVIAAAAASGALALDCRAYATDDALRNPANWTNAHATGAAR